MTSRTVNFVSSVARKCQNVVNDDIKRKEAVLQRPQLTKRMVDIIKAHRSIQKITQELELKKKCWSSSKFSKLVFFCGNTKNASNHQSTPNHSKNNSSAGIGT
ncbi:UNVERIFIED_CONTAM: hypothetical protein NCL1_41252 [Trichonephila clavipes]